jgi:hypothetical protein
MATKIELQSREENGKEIIALAFECTKAEEHEIIDAIRVAIFDDHPKRGGYVNSNRLIVEFSLDKPGT